MEKILKWALPVIQAAISALFLYIVINSGLFPDKYQIIAAAITALLLLITIVLIRSRIGVIRSLASVLSIFICGMLVFGMVYVNQIMKTLDSIAGSDTEVKSISVIVMKDNAANRIEETKGYRFGIFEGTDQEEVKETIEEVKLANTDPDLTWEYYNSPIDMAQALRGGEIDAAVYNKAYTEILDEVIVDFSSDSQTIYEKTFETKTSAAVAGDIGSEDSESNTGEESSKKESQNTSLTDHSFNVLVSGIDVSGPISSTSRSDVNIIMTINPLTHRILLTTTPRDYYVFLPGISGDMRDKLTHAGIYGVKTSMRALEELYGTDIQHYIRINFDSLIQLVDALGGIDVYSEYSFDTTNDEKEYSFYKGTNHLNGEEALAFARERYAFSQGDRQRGQNQMLVLTAIINKLQSTAVLKNSSGILDVVGRSMQTSIQYSQITDVIAWQLDSGESWDIERQSVSGTGDSAQTFSMQGTNIYVMWPDESSVSQATEKIEEVMEERE